MFMRKENTLLVRRIPELQQILVVVVVDIPSLGTLLLYLTK